MLTAASQHGFAEVALHWSDGKTVILSDNSRSFFSVGQCG